MESDHNSHLIYRQNKFNAIVFLVRHWRGEYSLVRSYWIHATLLVGLFALLGTLFLNAFEGRAEWLRFYSGVAFVFWPALVISWLWGVVGTWRSASRHVQRGGKAIWAALAQFIVILGAISTIGQIVTNGIPQMIEHAKIAVGRDPLGEAAMVRLASNGRSIEIIGPLSQGSSRKFMEVLHATSGIETVVLNSSGGRLVEAEAIADIVRTRLLSTYVEAQCQSACTLILIAGKDRAAIPNAKIGFHQPDFPGLDTQSREIAINNNRQMYRKAGIADFFIDKAMEAKPNDMWHPSHDEMLKAGVLTRTSLGGETATNFSTVTSREKLSQLLLTLSLFRTLQETRPALFEKIVNAAWKRKSQGGTDNDVLTAARLQLSSELPKLIGNSDADLRREYFSLMLDQLKAARNLSYNACALFMAGQLNIAQALPSSLSAREAILLERALRQTGASSEDPALANRGYEMIAKALSPSDLVALTTPDKVPANQRCDSTINFYSAANQLPAAEKAAVIRGIFSQANKAT